jgi:hypothetical protein
VLMNDYTMIIDMNTAWLLNDYSKIMYTDTPCLLKGYTKITKCLLLIY